MGSTGIPRPPAEHRCSRANGPFYTSLGQSPRITPNRCARAEGPIYTSAHLVRRCLSAPPRHLNTPCLCRPPDRSRAPPLLDSCCHPDHLHGAMKDCATQPVSTLQPRAPHHPPPPLAACAFPARLTASPTSTCPAFPHSAPPPRNRQSHLLCRSRINPPHPSPPAPQSAISISPVPDL